MIAAIIQARMGSKRLPCKTLAEIYRKPMLYWVVERVKYSPTINEIIVATTTEPENQSILALADQWGVKSCAGSSSDVLDRYYQAARSFGVDIVVRITADCPLLDPSIIDRSVRTFLECNCDYASTAYPVASFPDGLDVEVFSFCALEKAWKEASLGSEREHVTPYIWKNPHMFRLKSILNAEDLSAMRWTVDEERDLEFVREVYGHLYQKNGSIFGMNEVLGLLKEHPEILNINQGIKRNEGYQKSLIEDMMVCH